MTTVSDSEVRSAECVQTPSESENTPKSTQSTNCEVTGGNDMRAKLAMMKTYFTPPQFFSDSPSTLQEMLNYAQQEGWATKEDGPLRFAQVAYTRVIAIPATFVTRSIEWVIQRPGRAILGFALWKLFITTGPGPWLLANIFSPIGRALAWITL